MRQNFLIETKPTWCVECPLPRQCQRLWGADGGRFYTSELDNVLFHKQRYILTVILSPDSTEHPRDEGGPNGSPLGAQVSFSRGEWRGLVAILLIMPTF